jgi:hypothetical protein
MPQCPNPVLIGIVNASFARSDVRGLDVPDWRILVGEYFTRSQIGAMTTYTPPDLGNVPTRDIRSRVVGNGKLLELYVVYFMNTRFGLGIYNAIEYEEQQYQATQYNADPPEDFLTMILANE